MAKHLLVLLTTCFISLVLLGDASGTGNTHVEESHNIATATKEERTRRDVAELLAQRTTAVVPNDLMEEDNNQKSNQMNLGALKELSIIKRTPSGFMGMRGKKEYGVSDSQSDGNAFDWEDSGESDDIGSNDFNGNRFKKAPAGFYGVRGKKYTKGEATLGAGVGSEVTRLNEFLSKMEEERMREHLLQDLLTRVAASKLYQSEVNKRAPIGFTGVRGKRPLNLYYDDLEQDGELSELFEKRGPANAFVGLRGKKDVSHLNYKRSSMEPYNTRGRNQRFVDFSNKFVAVRGKKNSADDLSSFFGNGADTQLFSYPSAHERYLVGMLASPLYGSNGKRTPSGFMGMRGKRAATDATDATDTRTVTDEAYTPLQQTSVTGSDAQ